jgi:tetrahydromethanopterin S-methyltransferase subunit H
MLRYQKEQQVCDIGGLRVGGQPGENPPLLVGNMFQKGDALLKSRKSGEFDRREAEARIRELETVSQETGVHGMVALVANTEEEIKGLYRFPDQRYRLAFCRRYVAAEDPPRCSALCR